MKKIDRTQEKKGSADSMLTRRKFLGVSAAGGLAAVAGGAPYISARTKKSAKPNILYFITDQQSLNTMSSLRNPDVNTPSMDRIAEAGVSFTESYCTYPLCSPARSSLMTGRMPHETGVMVNSVPIIRGIPHVGDIFRSEGYNTVYSGKWHLPKPFVGEISGFDVIFSGTNNGGLWLDNGAAEAASMFLRTYNDSNPFCLVVSFLNPHDICQWLPQNKKSKYYEDTSFFPALPDNFAAIDPHEPEAVKQIRQRHRDTQNWSRDHWRYYLYSYYRYNEIVDGAVGQVMDALRESGLEEDTLVVYTADHGEGMAGHQMLMKTFFYEEAVKVPMIISRKGHLPEGRLNTSHLVSGLDIVPTICDFAGIRAPKHMRGYSLRPVLEGRASTWRDFVVSDCADGGRMVRTERYKYISYTKPSFGEQLFDLKDDPGETRSILKESSAAGVLEDHRKLLAEWEHITRV